MRQILMILLFCHATGYGQVFNWVFHGGSNRYDFATASAVDNDGNIYTVGRYSDTVDFDPGINEYNLISNGDYDAFVQKLDPNGNFVWAKSLGGVNTEVAMDVAVDWLGNVYVVGTFGGIADFQSGPGTYNLTGAGDFDAFIARFNSSGTLTWAKNVGGSSWDYGHSITVDQFGNTYICGNFRHSADFDPGAGTYTLTTPGNDEGFIEKFNSAGSLVWVKQISTTGQSIPLTITCDPTGNILVGGYFSGTADLNPGTSVEHFTASGIDAFLLKLNNSGNYVWAKTFGGTGIDALYGLTTDATGSVYATGHFFGTADFDPGTGTYNLISNGSDDVFILKLTAGGNLSWAKNVGGSDWDVAYNINLDPDENIYVAGFFDTQADLDPGVDEQIFTAMGEEDVFVLKLNAAGNYLWAARFGGIGTDVAYGMAVDKWGDVVTSGKFENTPDFDPGWAVHSFSSKGNDDIFAQKMNGDFFVSVNEETIKEEQSFFIYPNPANHIVNVTCENEDVFVVTISTLQGQIISSQETSSGTLSFNTSSFSNGVYVLMASGKNHQSGKKLIVQHE